jgi:hypothetical protein
MINANELRIGNFVDFGEVTSLSAKNINVIKKNWLFTCDYEDVNPIPLTEDWLIKFEFQKSENHSWFDKDFISISKSNSLSIYSREWFNMDKKIEYVHQLQNLYFALTQKELTISK